MQERYNDKGTKIIIHFVLLFSFLIVWFTVHDKLKFFIYFFVHVFNFQFFSATVERNSGRFSVLFVHSSYIYTYSWRQQNSEITADIVKIKEEPLKNHLIRQKTFYFQRNSIPLLDVMATKTQWLLSRLLGVL